jgi:hypothetical protein
LLIECGTLLEVHRPFDPTPLAKLNLQAAAWVVDREGNKITNMGIRQLCAGNYHLWFVYYARTGQFLKGVKTIYIDSPSCNC